jgi:hypothetical protein
VDRDSRVQQKRIADEPNRTNAATRRDARSGACARANSGSDSSADASSLADSTGTVEQHGGLQHTQGGEQH